jgi:hypothetical protein
LKKTTLALALVLVLLSVVWFGTKGINEAEANPIYEPGDLVMVRILSPANKSYNTNAIPLIIEADSHLGPWNTKYRVDDGPLVDIGSTEYFSGELNLADGPHSIVATTTSVTHVCAVVNFNVDTTPPFVSNEDTLIVVVDSPENRTYTSNSVTVSISASDPKAIIGPESISYILDGGPPVVIATVDVGSHTLNGSTVLSLPNGEHGVIGIGTTWFGGADGIFVSAPVYFTVNSDFTPSPDIPEFPSSIILTAFAMTTLLTALIYLKKLNHRAENGLFKKSCLTFKAFSQETLIKTLLFRRYGRFI